jgi:hypothetical protein
LGGEESIPASNVLEPADGLEQPEKAAVEARSGTTSKMVFVKVARRLCQLPV